MQIWISANPGPGRCFSLCTYFCMSVYFKTLKKIPIDPFLKKCFQVYAQAVRRIFVF